MDGVVFSRLNEIVENREVISEAKQAENVWGIMPYETAAVQGNALVAAEDSFPGDLVIDPKLTGWYRIYVGSVDLGHGISLQMKLDNEAHFSMFTTDWGGRIPSTWHRDEQMREFYYTCADMTDRQILVRKYKRWALIVPIAWLRFVPMSEEEAAAYKEYMNPDGKRNLHVHYDNAFDYRMGFETDEDLVLGYVPLSRSHAKICSQEILNDVVDDAVFSKNCRLLSARHKNLAHVQDVALAADMDRIVRVRADYLHSIGVQFFAAFRMSVANVMTPWEPYARYTFVDEHPELYIKTRDGRTCMICSYAYPETHQFVIDYYKRAVARGYDGVSLIFHRGMHIGFEQPVLDEFARRYDGLDARRVPMDDPRLKDVWCDFLTQFVRSLRDQLDAAFGRHIPINVITGHSPEISRRVGIDIEALCREGLIDSFCAETMSTYESLGGCLAEDGLIDLEKYKEELGKRYVVCRNFGYDPDNVKIGTPQFAEISKKYGVEFFAGMNPSANTAQQFVDWVKMQKELGATSISFFNYLEYAKSQAVTNAASLTAHDGTNPEFYEQRFFRVLSLDGQDMSTYPPNWRC